MMSRTRSANVLLIFLISPVISLLLSFGSNNVRLIRLMIWLFVAFYGFNYVLDRNADYDIVRYVERFENISESTNTLAKIFSTLYVEGGSVDLVEPVTRLLVSNFTSDYRFLTLAFGLIFGYFYSRNIGCLLEKRSQPANFASYLLLLGFATVISANDITVFRWMSASQVFLFGAFIFFLEEKKWKGLFIASLSVFFHFTFLNAVAVLLLYFLLGEKRNLIFAFFIISFFISELDRDFFRPYLQWLPGAAEEKYAAYLTEKVRNSTQVRELAFHAKYYALSINIFLIALTTYFHFTLDRQKSNLTNFLYFSIFFFALFNVLDFIQSIHRFTFFARMSMLAAYFLLFQVDTYRQRASKIVALMSPFLIFFIIVRLRMLLEFMGAATLFSNPLASYFLTEEDSIIVFIKSLL